MRVSTDDGRFGFVVTPGTGAGMYRFQIIIDGAQIGDTEPCFLETAMASLQSLPSLDDPALAWPADPASLLDAIESDDGFHDAALLQVAESLDGWSVRGYAHQGEVIVLARRHAGRPGPSDAPIVVSAVSAAEYAAVFGVARDYWAGTRHRPG